MSEAILVTGGAGYIGAHTAKTLAAAGFRPIVLDNLSQGHEEAVRWGPLVRGDVLDSGTVRDAIRSCNAAAVIHFAALAYVGDSVLHPAQYYRNNIAGTMSVLDAMRDTGCSQIVFSSTCAVYGQPAAMPITEATPPEPINPYGRTKLACEHMMRDYGLAYGIRSICLRYFNAGGADPDGEIGELHDPEPHLIPRALMAALGELPDFAVFGADYPTPDGTAIRDYIHVTDLALAHLAALRLLLGGHATDVFNLGAGQGASVLEVLDTISRVTGCSLPPALGARRPGDPAILVADAGRAQATFGFTPALSDIETIIRTAFAWQLSQRGLTKRYHVPEEMRLDPKPRGLNTDAETMARKGPVAPSRLRLRKAESS